MSFNGPAPAPSFAIGQGSASVGGHVYGSVTTNVLGSFHERMDDVHIDPHRTYIAADLDRFWEREWLDDTFDQFLKEHDSGFFLIEADAGVGKTTYAAWLSRCRGYPA